ncbi:MAG: choice-of-anchor D domain-containing protein, partial [Acidobacteria bacterium ACB2]|nr:choice-of-anchor D domain-containing protein [Acidobacteria bacterium ACB2]
MTTAEAPWLLSRRTDLLLFGGSTALALGLLLGGAATGTLEGDAPPWLWLAAVVGVDVAHVWSTGWWVYADREELSRRRTLYLAVPAAAWATGVVLHSVSAALFWRALAYLAVFHFVRQQYGWVALYRRKSGENEESLGELWRRLDAATIYACTVAPLVFWHASLPRSFHWFLPGDFAAGLPGWTGTVALWVLAALLLSYVVKEVARALAGRPVSWGKSLVVASTAATWLLGIVVLDSDYAFTVTNGATNGNEDLTFMASDDSPHFSVSLPADQTLAPGETSGAITVTFAPVEPTGKGVQNGTITVTGNDGTDPTDQISLTGEGIRPDMTTLPASLDFGDANIGSPETQMVTITNAATGTDNLEWTAVITAGGTDYSVAPAMGTLVPGASVMVTVTFAPADRNARNGTLRISGDDTSNPSVDVPLTGFGRAPAMTVTPSSVAFGDRRVGDGPTATQTITVRNTTDGNADLTFTLAQTGLHPGDFPLGTPGTMTLAPGNQTTFTVSFDPSAVGARSSTVNVNSNDGTDPTDSVSLTGNGTQAVISPTPATTLNIGNVHVNQTGNGNISVDNTGNATLSIDSMVIGGGPDANQFQFASQGCTGQTCDTNFTVPAGGPAATVTISCTPTSIGARSATLTINGDQESGDNVVALSCTGTAPEINVTPTTLAFGNVRVGTPTQLTFQVQNLSSGTGSETLDYTIMKSGAGQAAYTVAPACTTNCTVGTSNMTIHTVTFTPSSRTSFNAVLDIASDDLSEPNTQVTLTGTGIAPEIGDPVPVSQSHTFANTDVGTTSAAVTISARNTGNDTLTISNVVLTGGQSNQFRIATGSTTNQSVAAGNTATWTVVCEPTSTGAKTTTFRINSDALNDTTFDFTLNCTGEQAVFSFSPAGGLNFGQVAVGMSSTLPVTISNTGNQSGSINSIVSGNGVYTFSVVGGAPPRTVAAGASLTVNVTFTPVNGNVVSTNLTVMTDGAPTSSPASFNIPVTGDGTTTGIDVSVDTEPDNDVDLGNVRVGTTQTRTVRISNEGDTPFTLSAPTSSSGRCTFAVISPPLPAVINGGGTATFNVNVTPDALGGGSCNITVASSLPSTDTVTVSWNGVAPGIELLNPANGLPLDFAGVDVDAAPQTIGVQVRNSGTDVLTISGCALSGPDAARFSVQTCPNLTVPVGETTEIDVTFDPNLEALFDATLTLSVDALGVPTVQVQVEGVGVDQNIDLPALAYEFPDTFRNPDEPSVIEIIANNPVNPSTNAGAPVTVSMVSSTDAAVFEVGTPGSLTIDPGGELRVPVAFRPTSYTAFDGTITLMNDTTGEEMAQVQVTGQGISRHVMVGPGMCELGVTGVGVPITLSELAESNCPGGIAITNIDPDDTAYTVRELALLEDGQPAAGPFELVGPTAGGELAADATLTYDVVFAPEEAGDFTYELAVYLDGDPLDHARVTLHGRAVEVDVHVGGC